MDGRKVCYEVETDLDHKGSYALPIRLWLTAKLQKTQQCTKAE